MSTCNKLWKGKKNKSFKTWLVMTIITSMKSKTTAVCGLYNHCFIIIYTSTNNIINNHGWLTVILASSSYYVIINKYNKQPWLIGIFVIILQSTNIMKIRVDWLLYWHPIVIIIQPNQYNNQPWLICCNCLLIILYLNQYNIKDKRPWLIGRYIVIAWSLYYNSTNVISNHDWLT